MTTTESLRISNILALDALGTRLLAGENGLERTVLWAHSCELPSPHQWLGPDELLMTVGLCVPAGAQEQVNFIRQLDQAGLAGLAIGDDQLAPPLTPAMLAEADDRGFPVLFTSRSVPFATIGRMVAAANADNQTQQILTLSRLYHALLTADEKADEFLVSLGAVFRVQMSAVDVETGVVILPGALSVDVDELVRFLATHPAETGERISRIGTLEGSAISVWQLPTDRPTVLLIDESHGTMLDSFTAVHLGQAVSIEANRRKSVLLGNASKGRNLIAAVYSGDGSRWGMQADAISLGLGLDQLGVIVSQPVDPAQVVAALSLAGIGHASMERNGYLITCVSHADIDSITTITVRLKVRLGISRRFAGLDGIEGAALNAQWALESVQAADSMVTEYDEADFALLPRTPGESHEIIERILGPLMHEGPQPSPLLETLCIYLDEDKNWTVTAQKLGIHRQTLASRLQRIEKLTGRSLKSTRDLAELWIARTALMRP